MSVLTITTSKGQADLPPTFKLGRAKWGEKRLQVIFDPRIFTMSFHNSCVPQVTHSNDWSRIFVLFDKAGERHSLAFTTEEGLRVSGDPLPPALIRTMSELPDGQQALVYGTLRGQHRDHGVVSRWIPWPEVDAPYQLLLVVRHGW